MYTFEAFGIGMKIREMSTSRGVNMSVRTVTVHMKEKYYWGNIDRINMLLMISLVLHPSYKLKFMNWLIAEILLQRPLLFLPLPWLTKKHVGLHLSNCLWHWSSSSIRLSMKPFENFLALLHPFLVVISCTTLVQYVLSLWGSEKVNWRAFFLYIVKGFASLQTHGLCHKIWLIWVWRHISLTMIACCKRKR